MMFICVCVLSQLVLRDDTQRFMFRISFRLFFVVLPSPLPRHQFGSDVLHPTWLHVATRVAAGGRGGGIGALCIDLPV